MRHWNASFTRLLLPALANLLLVCSLLGCGGSAAETPEPVRPDDWQMRLRQTRQAPIDTARGDDGSVSVAREFGAPKAARSTWGSGRKRAVAQVESPAVVAPQEAAPVSIPAAPEPAPASSTEPGR